MIKKFFLLAVTIAGIYFLILGFSGGSFAPSNIKDRYYSLKSEILSKMASSKGEKGEMEKSEELFKKSEQATRKIDDSLEKAEKNITIAKRRLETNKEMMAGAIGAQVQEALKETANFDETVSREEKGNVFAQAAEIYAQVAPQLREQENPQDIIDATSNPQDASLFLFNVMILYLKEGKMDLAQETINKMPDEYYKKAALLALLKKAAEIGGNGENIFFEKILKAIDDPAQQAFIFLHRLDASLGQNDLEQANNLVNNVEDDFLRQIGLLKIADFQIANGQIDMAVKALKEMK